MRHSNTCPKPQPSFGPSTFTVANLKQNSCYIMIDFNTPHPSPLPAGEREGVRSLDETEDIPHISIRRKR
jgi:hypothetical protein